MNTALEEAIKEAYALAPANVSFLHTLELYHERMSESLYLVQGFRNIEVTLEDATERVFRAIAFDFTLPATNEGGLQELSITIDNVENRVSDFCKEALLFPSPVTIIYRPYLSTDLTTPQMNPPLRLFLLNVKISDAVVSGRAVPVDFLNLKFPTTLYTSPQFPAV